jgi:hypothetical protein
MSCAPSRLSYSFESYQHNTCILRHLPTKTMSRANHPARTLPPMHRGYITSTYISQHIFLQSASTTPPSKPTLTSTSIVTSTLTPTPEHVLHPPNLPRPLPRLAHRPHVMPPSSLQIHHRALLLGQPPRALSRVREPASASACVPRCELPLQVLRGDRRGGQ